MAEIQGLGHVPRALGIFSVAEATVRMSWMSGNDGKGKCQRDVLAVFSRRLRARRMTLRREFAATAAILAGMLNNGNVR